jgi:Fic family protein
MTRTTWIWTTPSWPQLSYSLDRLAAPLATARQAWGRLLGKAEAIDARALTRVQREVWSGEAMATAAIEGESLDLAAVRSSVARRLGLESDLAHASRDVEGLLDVMQDAAAHWDSDLSEDRLCRWQAALFPAGGTALRAVKVGAYRSHDDPMQVVSGPVGHEKVHYEAPPSAAVRAEMHNFLDWFNRTRGHLVDGLLRAGLAHVWFESIHPFEDGNGRIGRAIVDMALAQDARMPTRLHGVSAGMRRRQADYYEALNRAQRGSGDVTEWLAWFADVVADSCQASTRLIDDSLARARFWSDHRDAPLNERQRKVLNRMLEAGPGRFEGGLTTRKYVAMTGASRPTATRDIQELVARGLLVAAAAGGRSARYDIAIPGWAWMPES